MNQDLRQTMSVLNAAFGLANSQRIWMDIIGLLDMVCFEKVQLYQLIVNRLKAHLIDGDAKVDSKFIQEVSFRINRWKETTDDGLLLVCP